MTKLFKKLTFWKQQEQLLSRIVIRFVAKRASAADDGLGSSPTQYTTFAAFGSSENLCDHSFDTDDVTDGVTANFDMTAPEQFVDCFGSSDGEGDAGWWNMDTSLVSEDSGVISDSMDDGDARLSFSKPDLCDSREHLDDFSDETNSPRFGNESTSFREKARASIRKAAESSAQFVRFAFSESPKRRRAKNATLCQDSGPVSGIDNDHSHSLADTS